jgi:ketosteroid isomerase-like protein
MLSRQELLKRLYDSFNARDLEGALAAMHPHVVWANGLEGGYVHGRNGVREYWTEQWRKMDSRAEPLAFHDGADGAAHVEVHLTARDAKGNVLFDTKARHVFQIERGLIRRFDIA